VRRDKAEKTGDSPEKRAAQDVKGAASGAAIGGTVIGGGIGGGV